MKRIQIAVVALLVTCGLVASFAFTKKSSHRPVTMVAFDYMRPKNVVDFSDPNRLVVSELVDSTTSSWQQNDPNAGVTGGLLDQIQFDAEKGTIGQAASAVSAYYNTNHTLPVNSSTLSATGFGGTSFDVKIIRKATN